MRSLAEAGDASTLERSLTVVKVAKPKQDMRFDVPVIGIGTIAAMQQAGATCLAIEAERTLIFDLEAVSRTADAGRHFHRRRCALRKLRKEIALSGRSTGRQRNQHIRIIEAGDFL